MSETPTRGQSSPDEASGPAVPEDDAALLAECEVQTFRAGGKGGQHQNTTDSGVRLIHKPTGLVATSRDRRSQLQNRKQALARLRERLDDHFAVDRPRVRTKVPKRERQKRLDDKKRRSERKKLRRRPPDDS